MDGSHGYHKDLSHLTQEHVWERQAKRAPLAERWWRLAEGRAGMRVLDAGCGPGFFTLDLARRVGPEGYVLALDVNPEAVAALHARRPPPHVRALVWDLEARPPPEGGFDLVMLTDVLHHAERPAEMLARLLLAGRRLLVAEFDPRGAGEMGPPLAERISRADLARMLAEAGWRVLRVEDQPFEHHAALAEAPNR